MRILVVEDDSIISMALSHDIERLGLTVAGPAGTVAHALALIEQDQPSCALLDFRLRGETTGAVATALEARGIPYAWLTGYDAEGLPPSTAPVLQKPIPWEELRRVLAVLAGI